MAHSLKKDLVGAIAYTMTVDGTAVDEVPTEYPIEYLHGYENVPPGLEKALEGKSKGDTISVTLQPADAYGEYDEENVEEWESEVFEDFDQLEAGMEIELVDEEGDYYEATIIEVKEDSIILDFNSPLAGKVVTYNVQVMDVREATEAEIEDGIPASVADEIDAMFELDHDHDH